jgi:hypothetical protein
MAKFIKTALLQQKERMENQEEQLEEVRTGESYETLQDGLNKQHNEVTKHIEDRLKKLHHDEYDEFFEDLLDKAGLYSRKGSYDQPLGFMVESTNKGVDERHIQEKLKSRHTNK